MNNMQDIDDLEISNGYSEIDIRDLFKVLWLGKYTIIAITTVFAVASIFYALSIPNQYKATALLAPSKTESSGLPSSFGQLGGLASLAGVNLNSSLSNETQMAKAIMVSWNFIEAFIKNNNLAVELVAVESWNQKTNELQINNEIYDVKNKKWLVEKPSSWSLFKSFSSRLSVLDTNAGFLSISIEHYSPHVAKKWLDLYIAEINKYMQELQVSKVNNNINYLEQQIESTSIAEMKVVFFTIIEEQIKNEMLAKASPDYIFTPVSASMLPEEKSQPARAIICIVLTLVGGILSVLIVLVRQYVFRSKNL